MSTLVTNGTLLKCTQGASPCPLKVLSNQTVKAGKQNVATIMDFSPLSISTFGVCRSPANPAVAAAFGAPQPCIPVIAAPWAPPSKKTKVMKLAPFDDGAKCICAYAGQITVSTVPQESVDVE